MLSKESITQKIVDSLDTDCKITYDSAFKAWWVSFNKKNGFRLTDAGYSAIQTLNLKKYEFEIPFELFVKPRQLLILNRNLNYPYYLLLKPAKSKLILFGSIEATALIMFGNIERWLKSLDGY